MFHTPYIQTDAKFLEAGLIDIFLEMPAAFIRKHNLLCKLRNNAYLIRIHKYITIHVLFEDEFESIDSDSLIAFYNSAEYKRTIYCLMGYISVHHMVKAQDADTVPYKAIQNAEVKSNTHLHYIGSDRLEANQSMVVDSTRIVGISGDIELNCIFATLNCKPSILTEYVRVPFLLERDLVKDITDFKKRLRHLINSTMAINRLKNHIS